MKNWDKIGIADFLYDNPGMILKIFSEKQIVFEGTYYLCAHHPTGGNIDSDFRLRIEIPATFPNMIPIVREVSNKIPRDRKHHVNIDSSNFTDSLCLGSRIRILQKISENPTISGFVNKCVVPFLYAVVSGDFLFGELEHYDEGIFDDYKELFNVSSDEQVLSILLCISKKKRIANKQLCPCGCGYKLGKCDLHNKINLIRRLSSRNSFKVEYNNLLNEKRKNLLDMFK